MKFNVQIITFIFLTTILIFFSHVIIQDQSKLLIAILANGMTSSTDQYPFYTVFVAGITAIIPVALWTTIYYYAGHLIPFSNRFFRLLIVIIILLESHGQLFRYPLVSYIEAIRLGATHPALFILAEQLDKWIPNILFAFCLVFLCPYRRRILFSTKPRSLSILYRKLKNGKEYKDFRDAWLPPISNKTQYFDIPVQVIHAHNVNAKNEIISIGIIWATPDEALAGYKKYEQTEQCRHEKIDTVTIQNGETTFCEIIDIDTLGK